MAGNNITVVISQSQGKNPVKRQLEEEIAAALILEPNVDVSLVPHLYDMSADHTGLLFLRSMPGDLIVLSWLYPRGTHWILDRQGIRGQEGLTLLKEEDDDEEEDIDEEQAPNPNVVGVLEMPNRRIYCIDMRVSASPAEYLEEIRRIVAEKSVQTFDLMSFGSNGNGNGSAASQNGNGTAPAKNGKSTNSDAGSQYNGDEIVSKELLGPVSRRWYPVIDYSRCTNCMECIDFCLFGVYGVDQLDTILVEEQDSCKKGCPACSRVCPENAIIFPNHKTPAIAGAEGEVAGLKIDLSKLFGGGEEDSLETAIAERDRELEADGREVVGATVGIPERKVVETNLSTEEQEDLSSLLDDLDALDI